MKNFFDRNNLQFKPLRLYKSATMIKPLTILLCLILTLSCKSNSAEPSGHPADVLSPETYNDVQLKYQNIFDFENGTAIVMKKAYGLINSQGKEVLPCIYDTIYNLHNNIRIIVENAKIGLTDHKGKIVAECIYNDVKENFYDFIPLKRNDKWGFIDKEGKAKISFKFDDIITITDSVFVAKYDGKCGLASYDEKIVIKFDYDVIAYKLFDKKTSFVISNNKIGVVNTNNKIVTECVYDDWNIPSNGYVRLSKGKSSNRNTGIYGMINCETGEIVIPFEYQDLGNYSENLVMVKKNNKCGYVDIKNNVKIPLIYSDAKDFSEGLALVYENKGYTPMGMAISKCGYINNKGEITIPIKFSNQDFNDNGGKFSEGLASIGIANNNVFASKFGYIDKTGKFIIKPLFDKASPFEKGIAEVVINEKIGFIDKKQNYIIQCIYDERDYSYQLELDSTICLIKNNIKYYFDSKGNKKEKPKDK